MIKRDNFRFYNSESKEHQLMKKYVYDTFIASNLYKNVALEYDLGERIADVYLKLIDGKEVVVECQHSFITPEEIKGRTKFYNKLNMYVLWILNGKSFKKNPRNQEKIVFYTHEKTLFYLYRERVYYLNVSKDGIEGSIYPLYFTPYFEMNFNNFTCKKRYFKGMRSTIVGEIPNYELVFYENGYKITRFKDKNLKFSCSKEMMQFLLDYHHQYNSTSKKKRSRSRLKRIPLKDIIQTFKGRYGIYLPYQILNNRTVPIDDIKYCKDANGFYREYILFDKKVLKKHSFD
ncbi:MAG: hypothetical protein BAJALOKI2v1_40105 [Promethearchaeota archaeon]|nr:MAG: hypothetical protein BAJALOKI2v1_40105 [Candidatus Lokiarchaeota archaeon]